jgi:hypothetical protein
VNADNGIGDALSRKALAFDGLVAALLALRKSHDPKEVRVRRVSMAGTQAESQMLELCKCLVKPLALAAPGTRARCVEHGIWVEVQGDGSWRAQREPFPPRSVNAVPGLENVVATMLG